MTDHSDQPPTDHTGDRSTADHGPVSLDEAADRLGVTVNAVRQRLKRGTLGGHRTPDGWVVVWPPTRSTDRPATDHGGAIDAAWSPTDRPANGHRPTDQPADHAAGRPPAPVSGDARSQLAAIWDEWLAPLTARAEALARENGRLGAELAAAEGERDRLRAERDSDRVLADRLVDLLQVERDEARARVAEIEATVGAPTVAGTGHAAPYGVARRDDSAPGTGDVGALVSLAGGGIVRFLRLAGRVPGVVRGGQ